jgi:hypothetical protein
MLRRRMIEDMKIRNMSPNSQKVYTYAIATSPPSMVARPTRSASSMSATIGCT